MTLSADPVIVQFIHPGAEHRITPRMVIEGDFPWSTKERHSRKFMRSNGLARESACGADQSRDVHFWGEWEAPSRYQRLGTPWFSKELPTFIHEPYLPANEPSGWHQNTDPLVFGDHFMYTNCKQQQKSGRYTSLHRLPVGSLILFGSPLKDPARFVLDTVMVVAEGEQHEDAAIAHPYGVDLLTDVAYRPVANGSAEWTLTTYRGQRPRTAREPFSFTPAVPADVDQPWFPRPVVEPTGALAPFIVPAQPIGQVIRTATTEQVAEAWSQVVHQVVDRDGLMLATWLQPPSLH